MLVSVRSVPISFIIVNLQVFYNHTDNTLTLVPLNLKTGDSQGGQPVQQMSVKHHVKVSIQMCPCCRCAKVILMTNDVSADETREHADLLLPFHRPKVGLPDVKVVKNVWGRGRGREQRRERERERERERVPICGTDQIKEKWCCSDWSFNGMMA